MAGIKRTHVVRRDTNLRELVKFPEVKNKIIDSVEVSSDLDHFDITISFQDRTTLVLIVEPCAAVFPVLSDWGGGEQKVLKKYKQVRSKIPRT